ncbi:MAG: Efflux ABC transporter, ATP-binding protein [uncultured Thermomicrobiales bacterium]|uniref:Efflux ABC transporter, ATP-binding protein n=1 Tax=uncultured Thermomicrobiales bacterium TaxID=1645740 RepID=A0A6J4UFZ1_9BACT|nr:MAG: Efflux ABC transporter, ATP-binding protein [uncultured Thermomicrobiales bacterium]
MSLIEAHDLVKVFERTKRAEGRFSALRTLFTRQKERTVAVDGVSLAIDEGEVVGYLGPNGAGKSTTIKMLTGILVPTSGTATIAGIIPWADREANAMNIGVVFGQRSQLWWDLPLDESLRLIGKMYRVPDERFRRNRDMLVELLAMQPFLATPVRQLSLGQRMRGDIAAAVLYEPPVLFLDEPTVGLDVVAKERIREFIEEINRDRQTTVLLTTHDLDDVERLCKRILIIDQGKVLFDGAAADLKRRYAPNRLLDITVSGDGTEALRGVTAAPPAGVTVIKDEELTASFSIEPEVTPVAAVIADISARVPVIDITVREPEMDGIIREIYEAREVSV